MLAAAKKEIKIFITTLVTLIPEMAASVNCPAKYVSVVPKRVYRIVSIIIGSAKDKSSMV